LELKTFPHGWTPADHIIWYGTHVSQRNRQTIHPAPAPSSKLGKCMDHRGITGPDHQNEVHPAKNSNQNEVLALKYSVIEQDFLT
jgi:hypothetical protein